MSNFLKNFITKLIYCLLIFIYNANCLNILNPTLTSVGNLDIKSIKRCDEFGTGEIKIDMHLSRKTRNLVVLYGNITYKIPLDKDISLNLVVDGWGNGGWRKNFFVLKKDNACESMNQFVGKCWKENTKNKCNPEFPTSCPIPVGEFTCTNINSTLFSKCSVPYFIGKFRVHIEFVKDNIVRGCYETVFEING